MSISNFVSRILETTSQDRSSSNNTNAVVEISGKSNIDNVSKYPVLQRAGCVILHGPIDPARFSFSRPSRYNIILHMPNSDKMFSLHRTDAENEALEHFTIFKETLPAIITIDYALGERDKLDRICSKLKENRGWSAIHISAAFDYFKHFSHDLMRGEINKQEENNLRTPLHIAVLHKSTMSVGVLLDLGAQLDIFDIKNNSVFHMAAGATAKILQILDTHLERLPDKRKDLVNGFNGEGFTALHLACKANNADTVKSLLNMGADVNIPSPNEGYYPIHSAVKARSVCSIKELITSNPGQLGFKDLAEGGTPLHWSNGIDTLMLLLELGCDPNIPNDLGNTPLHNSCRRGCLQSTLMLLCHQAFADWTGEDGDTPLHVASRLCLRPVMQALIIFGADVNTVNASGHSPRHIVATSLRDDKDLALYILSAVGAKRCIESERSCLDGCKFNGSTEGQLPPNFDPEVKPKIIHEALNAFSVQRQVRERIDSKEGEPINFDGMDTTDQGSSTKRKTPDRGSGLLESHIGGRLLCLDGGGIRGLVLIQMLYIIEQELGIPVIDSFDFVAGSSTGGILALALACGKSVVEAQGIYLRLKNRVFQGDRPYDSKIMEDFLKQEFGCERTMNSIRRPRLMITSTVVDQRPCELHIFRNYFSPAALLNEYDPHFQFPEDQLVWEIAKVTGAAPSYFRLDHDKFIDGGLISNNPTLDALTELQQFNSAMRAVGQMKETMRVPTVVVSLGTGMQPKMDANVALLDISWPNGIFDAIAKVPRLATIVNLLVDQATQTEGQVVERSRAWCSSIGVPFFRFSPMMSTYIDLDETDDIVLVNVMWETRAYMMTNRSTIIEMKHHLFKNGSPPPEDM